MDELRRVFVAEAEELLSSLEMGLLKLEASAEDPELLNAIFRAAHTLKGSSGVAGLGEIERLTHTMEHLLDRVRMGSLAVSSELVSLLLEACDHLKALVEAVPDDDWSALTPRTDELIARLKGFLESGEHPQRAEEQSAGSDSEEGVERVSDLTPLADCWHLSVRFGRQVFQHGIEPFAFLRFLEQVGEILFLETLADALPLDETFDPTECYLGFEITLRAPQATKEQIEQVFAFCADECMLRIIPPHSKIEAFIALIEQLPEEPMRLGEILVRAGVVTKAELQRALALQKELAEQKGEAPKVGELLRETAAAPSQVVEAAAQKQRQIEIKRHEEVRFIRVAAEKLDHLINLVGELVIAGSSAETAARRAGETALMESVAGLLRYVERIRDSALSLRMVPIGEVFQRFPRVVRDTAKELGKTIELRILGAETELDKSMVELIADPLMHLVRNAIDHGIEAPEVRAARGKEPVGLITLNAYHDSGSIVVEVQDDGQGLPVEKIRAKAIERGLLAPDAQVSEQELIHLIFEPGFSTAERVTHISGRGVGMDVVRRNIAALRGTISVRHTPGKGTTFQIRLPLTLAIIDGFLVGVADHTFVIPLDHVLECVELPPEAQRQRVFNLRGHVLPYVRLRELYGIAAHLPARESVVVVRHGERVAGVVVDQLLGEHQTVIKPLSQLFRNVRGIGGATIMGSGEVALILDVAGLIAEAEQAEAKIVTPIAQR